jgi:LAGLIDADG DNA endonuclease family protein
MIVSLVKGFNFKFSIGLHVDDLNVLNYIKDKLGFGNVYTSNNTCHFNVTKKDDILKLINIFDIYLLNSKRFDYLDFKKAYYLYHDRDELTQELINQILDIKNNMNNSRKNLEILLCAYFFFELRILLVKS